MTEHQFAPFIRILGKGKHGTRSLDRDEARTAMGMILDDQVLPEQLGAFLMLLRVKEESPEELAGFVDAVKARYAPVELPQVDLDWSSYAGKKSRHPWFVLTALALADSGVRILMHGAAGHTVGRIYTEDTLRLLGAPVASSWQDATEQLATSNFSYLPLAVYAPVLARIIELRPVLGLRSPVHTLSRMLNPAGAAASIDAVFHPAYGPMHQKAAALLGGARNLTLKGDGGEAEARPDTETSCQWVIDGALIEESWGRVAPTRYVKETGLGLEIMAQVWRGTANHPYGEQAILSTLALVGRLLGHCNDRDSALSWAERCWESRDLERF